VSQEDSERSGLPVYDAGAAVKDFRITPGLVIHFSYHWHLGVGLRYQRLLSDAADSPVVDDRGSANQFITGLGLGYSW
jgi:outer membrane protein